MESEKLNIIIKDNLYITVCNIEKKEFIMWNDISNFLIMLLDNIKKNDLNKNMLKDVFDNFYKNYNPLKNEMQKIVFDDFISNLYGELLGSPWCIGPDIWKKNTTSKDMKKWSESLR